MSEYKEAAYSFEAVKTGMSQSKDGIYLRMVIHPEDCPAKLLLDRVGQRYGVAMVALAEDETPLHQAENEAIKKLKASAGALPREDNFQTFLGVESEDEAVAQLRERIGIKTRTEFDTNEDARRRFIELREEFQLWLKKK